MQPRRTEPQSLTLTPIGFVRSPFTDKQQAPRQPPGAADVTGTIELLPDPRYEEALRDLSAWSHIWVLFWFDRNPDWKPLVLPPRSTRKRGLFATRSPHRPNPIGMSVVRLERVEGRVLYVRGLDMLDGTPVLDIKPYVPYADCVADAQSGWLQAQPAEASDIGPRYRVRFSERADEQLAWLAERSPLPLRALIATALADGPVPHAYRRIKPLGGGAYRLGVKDFRARFRVDGDALCVLEIASGYRKRVLQDPAAAATERTPLEVHRAFVARFGERAAK